MYLCTTGIGAVDPRSRVATDAIAPGDQVLVSGPIGEHGTAIMLARGEFDLDAEIESDTCSLWPAVDALLGAAGAELALHARRDARRRRVGLERVGASVRRVGRGVRGERPGVADRGGRIGVAWDRSDVRRQRRAGWWRSWRHKQRTGRWRLYTRYPVVIERR